MATSPLFGWEEPDDTDLVKDGAAAIRTLGNAIDTSMGDLLGGTSGQVLSKASNANMDFTWVTSDDANAIQNAIVDAKGDLIAATAADTPARLAVGNNGEVLVADSSATAGLRWTATPSASNPLINSAFNVWQRGTSIAVPASNVYYTADRWELASSSGANYTISRQATGDTTNLPSIQYAARVQRDSGQTGLNPTYFIQGIESVNAIPYAGKTVTMSFYARRGANFSATSNVLTFLLAEGTGTDQNPAGAYDSQNNVINTTATLTTTWQRFSATGTIASTSKELKAFFTYTPTGTAGAADHYEVTGVQIDVGSVALPFRTYGATYQAELAACQRYCELITPKNDALPFAAANGSSYQGENVTFHVSKRVAASITKTAGTVDYWTGSSWVSVSPALAGGIDNFQWAIDTGTSSTNRLIRQNGATYLATAEL